MHISYLYLCVHSYIEIICPSMHLYMYLSNLPILRYVYSETFPSFFCTCVERGYTVWSDVYISLMCTYTM